MVEDNLVISVQILLNYSLKKGFFPILRSSRHSRKICEYQMQYNFQVILMIIIEKMYVESKQTDLYSGKARTS
jgi:hypothetical protein